jgi:hypothetical protein
MHHTPFSSPCITLDVGVYRIKNISMTAAVCFAHNCFSISLLRQSSGKRMDPAVFLSQTLGYFWDAWMAKMNLRWAVLLA